MRRLCTLLILLVLVTPAGVLASPDGGPRVRPADNRSRAVLKDGIRRSETVRTLLASLDRLDVIAYVTMQPALRGRLSGSLTWVAATARFRYVRVSLNPDLGAEQLVAVLAHELQHVVEIAEAPLVVDPGSMSALYRRIGVDRLSHTEAFDTEAAKRVGEQVRRELVTAVPSRVGALDPLGR